MDIDPPWLVQVTVMSKPAHKAIRISGMTVAWQIISQQLVKG